MPMGEAPRTEAVRARRTEEVDRRCSDRSGEMEGTGVRSDHHGCTPKKFCEFTKSQFSCHDERCVATPCRDALQHDLLVGGSGENDGVPTGLECVDEGSPACLGPALGRGTATGMDDRNGRSSAAPVEQSAHALGCRCIDRPKERKIGRCRLRDPSVVPEQAQRGGGEFDGDCCDMPAPVREPMREETSDSGMVGPDADRDAGESTEPCAPPVVFPQEDDRERGAATQSRRFLHQKTIGGDRV